MAACRFGHWRVTVVFLYSATEEMQEQNDLGYWKKRWQDGNNPWHKDKPHDFLVEYFGQCADGGRVTDVLVPLCGKSLDMKWLYDRGCRVCGVEVSELATKAFFEEQQMKYTRNTVAEFVHYQNDDQRLSIFCGDFFRFSKDHAGHQFDFVWDRGSFGAINVSDRKQYVKVVENLLLPTGRILLATSSYDPSKWPGPPHCVTTEDIHSDFGSNFHINHLCTRDSLTESSKKMFGVDWMSESCHMLSVKT